MSYLPPKGLVLCQNPDFFVNNPDFPLYDFTNCFTFMTGCDENEIQRMGTNALRPDQLGWKSFKTKKQWEDAVRNYFSPFTPLSQPGSGAHRFGMSKSIENHEQQLTPHKKGLEPTLPWVEAICFPMIEGATDYHWAIKTKHGWAEQAGRGGPLCLWETEDDMVRHVYGRIDPETKSYQYPAGSAFKFAMRSSNFSR